MKRSHFAFPEIYGDTLSYYELLSKLVDKTNELIDNYSTVPDQIAEEVKNLDASQLFSTVLNHIIHSIATDNTKTTNAVKAYKKHDLLYATFNDTVNLYESMIDFSTGTSTELIPDTNISEVNISELFIELRKLIDINKNNIEAVTAVANENSEEISTMRTMLSTPYNFKGDVSSLSALPSSGNVNDTYYVQDVKYKVTWTGSAWVQSSLSEADYQTELSELKSDLGYKSNLNTDNKTNIVNAINEVNNRFLSPVAESVTNWLNDHPEATTTVQDHSLSIDKMIIGTLGYVTPEMFGAIGDGVTDDSEAIRQAFKYGDIILFSNKTYYIDSLNIVVNSNTKAIGCGTRIKCASSSVYNRLFDLTDSKNIYFDGFEFETTRDIEISDNSGTYLKSMVSCFWLNNTENAVFSNLSFKSFSYDFNFKSKTDSSGVYVAINKNIYILNYVSVDGCMPIYAEMSQYVSVENALIKLGKNVSLYDHCVYLAGGIFNWTFKNVIFDKEDDSSLVLFNLSAYVDRGAIENLNVYDCVINGGYGYGITTTITGGNANFYNTKIYSNNGVALSLNARDGEYNFYNCDIYGKKGITTASSTIKKLLFKNCEIKSDDDHCFKISNSYTLVLSNCNIYNKKILVHISTSSSDEIGYTNIEHCRIISDGAFYGISANGITDYSVNIISCDFDILSCINNQFYLTATNSEDNMNIFKFIKVMLILPLDVNFNKSTSNAQGGKFIQTYNSNVLVE